MADDPSYAVQAAVRAALLAGSEMVTAFQALAANSTSTPRIYDRVPVDGTGKITGLFPYLTIGEDTVTGEINSCSSMSRVAVKVEVWSRSVDKGECKTLAGAARTALDADIAPTGHRVVAHQFESTLYRREGDGLTERAILMVEYLTEPSS